MIRALVMLLVLALVVPELASAATNGNGGMRALDPHIVSAPKPPKKKRKRKKKRPPAAPVAAVTHRFPVAGPFTWPAADGEFGAKRNGHTHQGVDLLAPKGTPVVAPYAGTITFVDYQ